MLCQNLTHKLGIFQVSLMNYFQLFLILSLFLFPSLFICIYEFYSIKSSHFAETKICVKLHPNDANTAPSYNLKSGTI